jgi:hypothetical protein
MFEDNLSSDSEEESLEFVSGMPARRGTDIRGGARRASRGNASDDEEYDEALPRTEDV